MIEWQPIETAPKDGARILMWDSGAWVAQWFSVNEGRISGWDADSHMLSQPTHWCPIQPPSTTAAVYETELGTVIIDPDAF